MSGEFKMAKLEYVIRFEITVLPHQQPRAGEEAIPSDQPLPSWAAARREMIYLHQALQRVLENHAYAFPPTQVQANLGQRWAPTESPLPRQEI